MTKDYILSLWDKYNVPDNKRIHMDLVAKVAVFFAERLKQKDSSFVINIPLLKTAALLHDVDKAVPKFPSERHPESAVRILKSEGLIHEAEIVSVHSVPSILQKNALKNWEQKLLFLADKMVKYSVLTVSERFDLWFAEDLPSSEREMLQRALPLVKSLELEVCTMVQTDPRDIREYIHI